MHLLEARTKLMWLMATMLCPLCYKGWNSLFWTAFIHRVHRVIEVQQRFGVHFPFFRLWSKKLKVFMYLGQ